MAPAVVNTDRLRQLAAAVSLGNWSEFSMRVPAEPDRDADLVLLDASIEIDQLRAFKAYVHARLDAAGIPTHPDGEHSKAGCRIGDRLDIVVAALEEGTVHATAWRTLGYVLGKFPELSGVIVDELRLLEVLGEKL